MEVTNKKERAPRVTEGQKQALVEFLNENPNFASRKFSNKFTAVVYEKLWEKLANILNTLEPEKNIKNWKKYLNDSKGYAKRKIADTKKNYIKTGGGIDEDIATITDFDEKLIDVCGGSVWVEGSKACPELGFNVRIYSEFT